MAASVNPAPVGTLPHARNLRGNVRAAAADRAGPRSLRSPITGSRTLQPCGASGHRPRRAGAARCGTPTRSSVAVECLTRDRGPREPAHHARDPGRGDDSRGGGRVSRSGAHRAGLAGAPERRGRGGSAWARGAGPADESGDVADLPASSRPRRSRRPGRRPQRVRASCALTVTRADASSHQWRRRRGWASRGHQPSGRSAPTSESCVAVTGVASRRRSTSARSAPRRTRRSSSGVRAPATRPAPADT